MRPRSTGCLKRATERDPDVAVTADDDVTHELWVIGDAGRHRRVHARLRCAARRLHRRRPPSLGRRRARGGGARRRRPDGSHRYFLSVIFPHHEMTILDYNRVVRDLNGRTPEQLLAEIAAQLRGHARPPRRCGPAARASSACTSAGAGIGCKLQPELVPDDGPDRPPADHAARPQPDRADPRRRRPAHRQAHRFRRRRARPGRAGAARQLRRDGGGVRALFPTSMDDLMAVADAGEHHAAQVDLVRAQARRRHGESRHGLDQSVRRRA